MGWIQRRLAVAGLAKQTALGSPAASPTYTFGLLDGNVYEHEIDQEAEQITFDKRMPVGVNRVTYIPKATWKMRAYPKTIGLLFRGMLGTIVTSGPASGVYTHVMTPGADTDYHTVFGRHGAEYTAVVDAKIEKLTITGDGSGPLEVEVTWVGCNVDYTSWSGGTAEEDSGGKFRSAGGTFKADVISNTPALADITAWAIAFKQEIDPKILAKSIRPTEIPVGDLMIEPSLTLKPSDLSELRKIVTGTANGTTVKEGESYGGFDIKCIIDANTDLAIVCTDIGYVADVPSVDPSGGALELELEGVVTRRGANVGATITVRNNVVSY